ncbi:MAG: SH3 domain-containing protein, partial [Clostridia bacterium]|nr:SH3 domain-containing protein [Clostridia bacterium]
MKRFLALTVVLLTLLLFGCSGKKEQQAVVPTVSETAGVVDVAETEALATPGPTPEPTPETTPVITPEPTVTAEYKCRARELNLRAAPDLSSEIVGKLTFEETVGFVDKYDDKFSRVIYNDRLCYCYSSYIVPADEVLYGYLPAQYEYMRDEAGNIVYEEDGVTPITLSSELIDIRLIIPDIVVYQIFGTEENFTGNVLYHDPVPVIQTKTAQKLAVAAAKFR